LASQQFRILKPFLVLISSFDKDNQKENASV
jgi:hypothetical protein